MSANSDVKAYLDYYLDPNNTSDFAIMLDGPWGSGKTFFIETFMSERHRAATTSEPLAGPTHLYASLYGVRSTEQITEQFFAQAHPVMNSKAVRLVGSVMSRWLNGYAGTEVNSGTDNNKILKDLFLNLEGRALVFDDLERCSMSITDVMGFINGFVEQENLKVVVIANQAEIPENQRKEYELKKEKLIGKTLRVGSDPSVVFDLFVNNMRNQAAKKAAIKAKGAVLRTFVASGKQNLRSLRAVLNDYDRLVELVDPSLQKSDEALSRLLLYVVATGLEFRANTLSASAIASLSTTMVWVGFDVNEKSKDVQRAKELRETYPEVAWTDPVIPSESLSQLYSSGIIEISSINEHLLEHPLIVGHKGTPAWRQLWRWDEMTRTQYDVARSQLLDELRHYKLTHPGVILHAAGEVLQFAEFGDNFLGDGVDIVNYFNKYIDKLLDDKRLVPARELFGHHSGSYAALGYHSSDTEDFQKIKQSLGDASRIAFSWKMQGEAETLFARLMKGDVTAYASLHEYGVDEHNYGGVEILHYIDVSKFADIMIIDSRPNDHLFAALKFRYDNETHQGALASEYNWIHELYGKLEQSAAKTLPPYKKLLEIRISIVFGKIKDALPNDSKLT
jgi:hypothetical protein